MQRLLIMVQTGKSVAKIYQSNRHSLLADIAVSMAKSDANKALTTA